MPALQAGSGGSLPSYRLAAAVEPFYAGGALTLLPDGRVACACSDEVKVCLV
jgi:hypothetical protein